jgi:hypothetical protein
MCGKSVTSFKVSKVDVVYAWLVCKLICIEGPGHHTSGTCLVW